MESNEKPKEQPLDIEKAQQALKEHFEKVTPEEFAKRVERLEHQEKNKSPR